MRVFFTLAAMVVWLASASGAQAQSVADYAAVSAAAYHVGEPGFAPPRGYKLILAREGVSIGFGLKALAVKHEASGAVIIAIAGTEFRDPLDILASLALTEKELDQYLASLKQSDAYTTSVAALRDLDRSLGSFFFGTESAASTVQQLRNDRQALLEEQLQAAKAFIAEVEGKNNWFGLFSFGKTYILTGHSLGGYFAQIIGAKRGYETHTFNAPGAASYMADRGGALAGANVTNHIRNLDIVGNFGRHIGRVKNYPNADGWFLDPSQNHSIDAFAMDIANGFAQEGTP